MERERALDALQIAKRQAFEEAEIASGEEIERSRIATERGLGAARLARDGDLRQLAVERDKAIEIAEMQKAIEVAKKSAERSAAVAASETARAKAVEAEEQAFTVREREIAERRKLTDLIGARRENEREALRLTSKADAEKAAATSFADAVKIAAQGEAEAEKIRALAAAARYDVDAKGRRQLNDAENLLSDASRQPRVSARSCWSGSRASCARACGRWRRSTASKFCTSTAQWRGGGNRNVTDEVIDFALALSRAGADDRQPDEGNRHRGRQPWPDDRSAARRQGHRKPDVEARESGEAAKAARAEEGQDDDRDR